MYNSNMNETEQREYFTSLTKEQITEILIATLANEKELREALDKSQGVIR